MTRRDHFLCWALLTLLLTGSGATAQIDTIALKRGPYNLVIMAGAGLSYYATHLGVPPPLEQLRVSRVGLPATVRAMWYPDHRLRVGLETGWVPMYAYQGVAGAEPVRVNVGAIPILLIFSMPLAWLSGTERSLVRRLSISGGTGAYLVQSRLRYTGSVVESQTSLGWMAAGAYTQPIGRRLRVAAEVEWLNATTTEDAAFTAQLKLVWRAFSW